MLNTGGPGTQSIMFHVPYPKWTVQRLFWKTIEIPQRSRIFKAYYRPQTKFAKVMFLQVSVCPQGGVPGQVIHPIPWQVHPPPPGRYTPWAGTPPAPRQVHPPTGTPTHPPPATVHAGILSTSGRYASHWNAFSLLFKGSQCTFKVNITHFGIRWKFSRMNNLAPLQTWVQRHF